MLNECTVHQCLTAGAIGFTGLIQIMFPTVQAVQEKVAHGLAYRKTYKWRGKEKNNPRGEKKKKAKRKNKCTSVPLKSHKSAGICNSGKP